MTRKATEFHVRDERNVEDFLYQVEVPVDRIRDLSSRTCKLRPEVYAWMEKYVGDAEDKWLWNVDDASHPLMARFGFSSKRAADHFKRRWQ